MRQLPILFSTPMVQAIQENRKTMTRRTRGLERINELSNKGFEFRYDSIEDGPNEKRIVYFERLTFQPNEKPTEEYHGAKPAYQVGDQLWVKETYYAYGYWIKSGEKTKTGKDKKQFIDNTLKEFQNYLYEDNKPDSFRIDRDTGIGGWFKRPSLHMPKTASRLRMEVTNVRCERLKDITEADAIAEGIETLNVQEGIGYKNYTKTNVDYWLSPQSSFFSLWILINGLDSLNANPWLFVYTFKRIPKP